MENATFAHHIIDSFDLGACVQTTIAKKISSALSRVFFSEDDVKYDI
jgi:hypothetical protein